MLLSLILLCFLGQVLGMIFPALTGASQAPEIAVLAAYQFSVGIPVITAITMLFCPALTIMLINTTHLELKTRILICRIISFGCLITIFFLNVVVNLSLYIYSVAQGMMEGTQINTAMMVAASAIGFLAYLTIVLLLTLRIKWET